jgi:uncharacterized protein (DUF1015 family)
MPAIEAFKGLRYNPEKVGAIAKLVTPPYDVISAQGQNSFYQKSPWNFIRIIYGKTRSTDKRGSDRYSRAHKTMEQWIRSNVLKRDTEPSLYPYLQEYQVQGKRCRRWGLIGLVPVNSPKIYPHERTRPKPKQDRIRLIQTVGASLSPLFGLVPDWNRGYEKELISQTKRSKRIARVTLDDVRHTVWQVSDPSWIRKIQKILKTKEMVIADGHHRFEAAKTCWKQARKKGSRIAAASRFCMFYVASAQKKEPGLLPTHRLLNQFPVGALKVQGDRWRMHKRSKIQKQWPSLIRQLKTLKRKGQLGLGLVLANGAGGYLMEPKRKRSFAMDVEWLHEEVLPSLFGAETIGAARAHSKIESELEFTQDLPYGLQKLHRGEAKALFVLQPPTLDEVFRRARKSIPMQGKTTFFIPKPLAGFVAYPFRSPKGS